LDCDRDAILVLAKPHGPVCHTGADTCFVEKNISNDVLNELERIIYERKNNPSENSYTASLFAKGINKIAQKVGEEATELVIEAKDNNGELFRNEAADLLFHYLVLLAAKDTKLEDVLDVLRKRHKK
jgi:phosphoribosyl-ATP pyrophosphohydrolase/phosphoribosyl-AMP cyclohydrolase